MLKQYKIFLIGILILIVGFSISCSQQKTAWQGTSEEVEGVSVVKNPKEPLYGEDAFVLEEELTIGEAEGREEYMFHYIINLAVSDKGEIYVLDNKAQHVKVFDQDGQYLRTIGRPGEGPGEVFQPRSLIYSTQNELIIANFRNISYFSLGGEYLRSISIAKERILSIDVDNVGNIFAVSLERDKGVYELKKYDPDLNKQFSIGSSPLPGQETRRTGKRNAFFTILRWDIINADQVVTGYAEDGYILKIFDADGKLTRKIEKDYTPIEISRKDLEKRKGELPMKMRENIFVPKYFPPFVALKADDEGRIWVVTSKKTADGEKRYIDVFDSEGKYILEVALKATPRLFNNKLYMIESDEYDYQYVKRYKVTWKF